MMKKGKENIFNFDQDEELKIYKYAIYEYVRKQRKAKKLPYKYYSLKEWKSDHVMKKYENITVNSLVDFHKYLSRILENLSDKDVGISGFIYPILVLLIGSWSAYILNSTTSVLLGLIGSEIGILLLSYKIIKEFINNDIVIKNLYRDYIETIGELIQVKEKKVDQDGAEVS